MLRFILFCIFCYILFAIGSVLIPVGFLIGTVLLPIVIVIGLIAFVVMVIRSFFDLFFPRTYNHWKEPLYYRNRNPIVRLLARIWGSLMGLVYHVTFTISKAIQDSKR